MSLKSVLAALIARLRHDPAPAAVVAPPAPVVASAPRLAVGVGSHGSPKEAAQLASLGTLTRITYYTQSPPTDKAFAARLADLRAHRLDVLVVVHDFDSVRTIAECAALLSDLARKFRGTLWQIGNEYDAQPLRGFQHPFNYAALMQSAVATMRAADPTCRIVGMGLAGDTDTIVRFTRGYQDANGPTLDAWCVHCYGVTLAHAIEVRVTALRALTAMPIWVTETGMDSGSVLSAWGLQSLAQYDAIQASECVTAWQAAKASGAERLYFYQLVDGGDYGYGWLRDDAVTERPVCAAMRKALA